MVTTSANNSPLIHRGLVLPDFTQGQKHLISSQEGYYIFFKAEMGSSEPQASGPSYDGLQEYNSFQRLAIHNGYGFASFLDAEEATQAYKKFEKDTTVTIDEWRKAQWMADIDGELGRLIEKAKKDLMSLQESAEGDWAEFNISWRSPVDIRLDFLREELQNERGWPAYMLHSIRKSTEDLEEGQVHAWDATRQWDLVYCEGKLVGATVDSIDFSCLFDDQYPAGIWYEEVWSFWRISYRRQHSGLIGHQPLDKVTLKRAKVVMNASGGHFKLTKMLSRSGKRFA
ncbi:hypothetical protein BDZ91DRAFT_763130 [Kalaharituber pfeilii]|nr:hypothetical protein BDZ91DRAFT_763130 [Kalaharituber pfeilii]